MATRLVIIESLVKSAYGGQNQLAQELVLGEFISIIAPVIAATPRRGS
jgi:hypothetical protein